MQIGQGVIPKTKTQEYYLNMYKAYTEFGILPSQFKKELSRDIKIMHLIDNTFKQRKYELHKLEELRNSYKFK